MVSYFRGRQRAVKGDMGVPFSSPKKKRTKFGKEKLTWKSFDPTAERDVLNNELSAIQARINAKRNAESTGLNGSGMYRATEEAMDVVKEEGAEITGVGSEDVEMESQPDDASSSIVVGDTASMHFNDTHGQADIGSSPQATKNTTKSKSTESGSEPTKRRLVPNIATEQLHSRWEALLPTLVNDYLQYAARSHGDVIQVVDGEISGECSSMSSICKTAKSTTILCLYFDHFKSIVVHSCSCRSLQQILVNCGLFPTAPSQTRIAVSIDLLLFHAALFQRSCDAVNALALALNSFYSQRGFDMLHKVTGERVKEPFRKSLGYASQWLDILRLKIEDDTNAALALADKEARAYLETRVSAIKVDNESNFDEQAGSSHASQEKNLKERKIKKKVPAREVISCGSDSDKTVTNSAAALAAPTAQKSRKSNKKKSITRAPASDPEQSSDHSALAPNRKEDTSTNKRSPSHPIKPGPKPKTHKEENHPLMPPTFSAPTECDQRLAKLCPACFGGNKFGRSLVSEGADFHVATDGNFHHRHSVHAGAGVPFHKNPKHIIPAEYVNKVGEHIASVRKRPAKRQSKSRSSKVPKSALDECERSYEAANGDKKKAVEGNERYDDQGLMSLVCRHDVPLFFANIDTPGEQQKYAVALILWLFQYIPQSATVVVLYDIGCVLDRSVSMYNILPKSVLKRIRFTTTAMHAYGHQWSCQLEYNPRLVKGVGLTDGEGVERTWSKTRKMIGIVRSSSRARRIWVIDRQLSSIATETGDDLGTWMKRRLREVEKRTTECEDVIAGTGHSAEELRAQWELQRIAQLSVKLHTPAEVKAEIECVLVLQEEIETLEACLASTRKSLKHKRRRKMTCKSMDSFKSQIEGLVEEVEQLFVSLKIHRTYPELKGLGADFVRTLVLASELKDAIRRQAVESFFELERLDQAVGGRHQALGTKLHQQTRKAMNKRSPALVAKIKKFNAYCDRLAILKPEDSNIVLPSHLSTKVAHLRDDPNLMQDVWVSGVSDDEEKPWMDDPAVRKGIQAVLKLDRCLEERRRIGMEADNMCRQFGRNLLAAEVALRRPENASIARQLTTYHDHLLHLKPQWITPLATAIRYQTHVEQSTSSADIIAGTIVLPALNRVSPSLGIDGDEDVELADVDEIDVGQSPAEAFTSPEAMLDVDDLEAMHNIEDNVMVLSGSDSDASESECEAAETLGSDSSNESESESESTKCGSENNCSTVKQEPEVATEQHKFWWRAPKDIRSDTQLVKDIKEWSVLGRVPPYNDSSFSSGRAMGRLKFEKRDLQILSSDSDLLNDVCLNGCAELLQRSLSTGPTTSANAQRCAIFTTYDIARWRLKRKALQLTGSDTHAELEKMLWKNSKRTSFWSKEAWVLPIHRPGHLNTDTGHWVLCVAYPREGTIYLYDSFVEKKPWETEAKDVAIFFSQLVLAARQQTDVDLAQVDMVFTSSTNWDMVPALTRAVQSNGYDCGLWVLVWMAATLRGFHLTCATLSQSDMPRWRGALLNLVIQNTDPYN